MRFLRAIYRLFASVIDVKFGLAGAIFLGCVVFGINYSGGWELALVAALKQAVYTFFFGGFVVKVCEWLSTRIANKITAHTLGTLIPALIAVAATFGVHSMKGTDEPLWSTLPTLLTAPFSFFFISLRKRKKLVPATESEEA